MSGSQRDSDGTLIERIPPYSSGFQRNLWSVHSCIKGAHCHFILKIQCIGLWNLQIYVYLPNPSVLFKKGNPSILDLTTLLVVHYTSQDTG